MNAQNVLGSYYLLVILWITHRSLVLRGPYSIRINFHSESMNFCWFPGYRFRLTLIPDWDINIQCRSMNIGSNPSFAIKCHPSVYPLLRVKKAPHIAVEALDIVVMFYKHFSLSSWYNSNVKYEHHFTFHSHFTNWLMKSY